MKNVKGGRAVANQIMKIEDVAEYLHCHYTTVYQLVRRETMSGAAREARFRIN
jgi:excisionase family DNA binding protein